MSRKVKQEKLKRHGKAYVVTIKLAKLVGPSSPLLVNIVCERHQTDDTVGKKVILTPSRSFIRTVIVCHKGENCTCWAFLKL